VLLGLRSGEGKKGVEVSGAEELETGEDVEPEELSVGL
jgi:hypothetical protein